MFNGRLAFILGLLLLASSFTTCAGIGTKREYDQMKDKTIQEVQEAYTKAWMALPGVVGTGIGQAKGKPCIKVFVLDATEELSEKIPSSVGGFPVVLEPTGPFRARE